MKLNLLPTYVSKDKQARTAIAVMVLLIVVGVVGAVVLSSSSKKSLDEAIAAADEPKADAEKGVQLSLEADQVIESARVIIRDINLAQAMQAHSTVYPDLYDRVQPYIPGFFRVNSMTATPTGAGVATVSLNGTIKTYQQYSDLMLALLRIPNAQAVSRTGFTFTDPYVPGIGSLDQYGRPHKPGAPTVPDDPLQRLNQKIGEGRVTGFLGQGGYGAADTQPRGAMPGYSLVTVTVVLPVNVQTPNPRATLSAQIGAGGGGTGSAAGNPAGFNSTPTPPPASTPPPTSTPPPSSSKTGKKGKNSPGDEE